MTCRLGNPTWRRASRLSLFTNTLNHPTNSCNPFLAGETTMMGKEHFKASIDAANQAQRTDPVPGRADVSGYKSAMWNDAVPRELRYDPNANPRGARPTIFDVARNIYGIDPKTGYAARPFDNVGIQYGLAALNAGVITTKQFLDLNERIGGYDQDASYVASRSVGDEGAIARAYRSGVTLGGGGRLASIPVVDAGGYNETGGYHYQWFHFAVRERMRKENGSAENHLMWRGAVPADRSWDVIVKWVAAVKADQSVASAGEKVIRHRPSKAVDGCWTKGAGNEPAQFIAEPQTFSSKPDSRCNSALPSYSFTRKVAGGPLNGNVLKCQLKPIDPKDYAVSFTASELQRLRAIFPSGVCDWSRPGVNQVRVVPWASFGPSPTQP